MILKRLQNEVVYSWEQSCNLKEKRKYCWESCYSIIRITHSIGRSYERLSCEEKFKTLNRYTQIHIRSDIVDWHLSVHSCLPPSTVCQWALTLFLTPLTSVMLAVRLLAQLTGRKSVQPHANHASSLFFLFTVSSGGHGLNAWHCWSRREQCFLSDFKNLCSVFIRSCCPCWRN